MTRILAIDPGSEQSGWAMLDGATVVSSGKDPNDRVLAIAAGAPAVRAVVIEWTAPRGMPASAQLFEAMWWAGRFTQAAGPGRVVRINRADVKRHHCGTTAAKDTNVVHALIDRYGGTGGRAAAVGTKAAPGPLHGVRADAWQAVALGLTYIDQLEASR